jgi:hypothetical protein
LEVIGGANLSLARRGDFSYAFCAGSLRDRHRFIPFQLPTLVDEPPTGDGWLDEIKHDDYRTELIIEHGEVRASTRRGFDWTENYQPIVDWIATSLRLAERFAHVSVIEENRPIGSPHSDDADRSSSTKRRSVSASASRG